ncbi:MAG: Calx-beta domain-containing protein [Synechococcaceae cyanobacterium]
MDLDATPNTISFSLTPVNDAPTGADKTITTLEDTAYSFTAADFGFSDPADAAGAAGANSLQSVILSSLPSTGSLQLSGAAVSAGQEIAAASLASLTYTPAANANGNAIASFSFRVRDNGGTANGGLDLDPTPNTIRFDATPVNDPPTATNLSAAEQYNLNTPQDLIDIVVSDVDSPTISATLTLSNPAAGSLSTATVNGVSSSFSGGVWSATGAIAAVNALLAGVSFVPAAGFSESFSIATSINDGEAPAITGIKPFSSVPPLTAPTVNALVTNDTTPLISGTVLLLAGQNFKVQLGSQTYTYGSSAALQLSGNNWTLQIPADQALSDGTYNVVATVFNSNNQSQSDSTTNELKVDTLVPSLALTSSDSTRAYWPLISGTSEAGLPVQISIGGATYQVLADGTGLWSLNTETATPTAGAFNPNRDGLNTLTVQATDPAGNTNTLNAGLTIRFPYPDLVLTSVSLASGTGLSSQILSAVISNATPQGPAGAANTIPASAEWLDRYFLSPDPIFADGNDIGLGDFILPLGRGVRNTGPLAPGESRSETLNVQLPELPGDYYLIAALDNTTAINEGLGEANNIIISATPVVRIDAVYNATVSSNRDHLTAGESVELSGLLSRVTNGAPVANKPVTITLTNTTSNRVITFTGTSGSDGSFRTTFVPTIELAGNYSIAARWSPNLGEDSTPEDSFSVAGLGFVENGFFYSPIAEGNTLSGNVTLRNYGPSSVTNLSLSSLNLPGTWTFTTTGLPASLASGATATIPWQLTVPDASVLNSEFQLVAGGTDGSDPLTATKRFGITVDPKHSVLVATPNPLSGSVLRGSETPLDVLIRNTGSANSGPINVVLPFPWMRLNTSSTLAPLAPGKDTTIHLTLAPPADLQLGLYSANIGFLDETNPQYSSIVPFSFRTTSSLTGSAHVRLLDDLSLAIAGTPTVANAEIELLDGLTGSILRRLSDEDGVLTFADLPEGDYQIRANADKHSQGLQRFSVRSGSEQNVDVFLPYQAVRYSWVVVPITLSDEYKITLDATFETEVPIPVLTISPGSIDLCPLDQVGEQQTIHLTLTNHGLVRASDLHFLLPSHPNFNFSLTGLSPTLEAKQSEVVRLTIDRIADNPDAPTSINWGQLVWEYTTFLPNQVAPIKVERETPLPFLLCPVPLPGGGSDLGIGGGGYGGGGGGGGGYGGGGGFSFNPGVSITVPSSDPVPYVTARVGIQLNQRAVLSRAAFEGTFTLENLDPGVDLSNILVELDIYDKNGQLVNDRFAISSPTLSGFIGNINGSGSLNRGQTGTAVFSILANNEAAPIEPTDYSIGGHFSYLRNDNVVNYNLIPAPITVAPAPLLSLDYFLQRDVFSDDPFTTAMEPTRPFVLGLLARNSGYGAANNFTITSGQPQIVDNQTGLLIDFKLIGSSVGSQTNTINPSLTVNLGNLAAQSTAEAHWLMTSTLQGRFIDYKANVEYVNPLGFKDLAASFSQLQNVKLHELNHMVRDDRAGADNLFDYLVNDNPPKVGEDNTGKDLDPDHLYLSNGNVETVDLINAGSVSTSPTGTANQFSVSFLSVGSAPWKYLKINDPSNGAFPIVSIQRQDGSTVDPNNYWITDRTFPESGRPIYEYKLHLLDHVADGASPVYTIVYNSSYSNTPPVLNVPLANQQAFNSAPYNLIIPSNTFGEVDPGDQLFYAARLVGGAALPAWLSFDPITRRFSGTPGPADLGTLNLEVVATDNAGASAASSFQLLVSSATLAPTLAITAVNADQLEGDAGSKAFTFSVSRSGDSTGASSASWAVTGSGSNPATAADFHGALLPSGMVSFAAGETSQTITVQVNGDTVVENDEGFTVTLSSPSGATIAMAAASGTIRNDDVPPPPTLAITAVNADQPEGDAGSKAFTFSVSRSGDSMGASSASWAVTGSGSNPATAADFHGALLPSGMVNFAAGETSQTITVQVNGDTVVENDEGFTVTLGSPSGATIAMAAASGTIRNDDVELNKPPTAVALTNVTNSLAENTSTSSRIKLAEIAISDDALGSNSISLLGADAAAFEVDGSALYLKAGTSLDYETKTTYAVTVSVSDTTLSGSTPVSTGYSLAISDVNEAPTALVLSATTFNENIPAGTLVASLISSDPDTSLQSFSYALVAGAGDTDNLAFYVTGNQLHLTRSPDYEVKSSYSIRLRTTDQGGLSFERNLQLAVNDLPDSPSYSFSSSAAIVYEGGALALGIGSSNVAPGTRIYWSFSGTGINSADFNDGMLSGAYALGADGGAAFTKTIAADRVVEGDEALEVKFFSDLARSQQLGSTILVTIKDPLFGGPTDGPDNIIGSAADEMIKGVPTGSMMRGLGTVDKLTGGGGKDNFLLGDAAGVFYDDGNPTVQDTKDMAWITDFSAGDKIVLSGNAANYQLVSARYSGFRGVQISALLPASIPEPIGFVQGATTTSLDLLNASQFTYLGAP